MKDQPSDAARPVEVALRLSAYHAPLVLLLGFLIRAWLIETHPIIFGGDTIVRLVNRDRILLSYQLPLLQAALHYLSKFSGSITLARYLMAVIGAVAGLGFYRLAAALLGPTPGFFAALLFVSNPFLLAHSIVPYQEIVMLAGLAFAFHSFFAGNQAAASLSLAVACLTRYEAWAACPILALAYALERKSRPTEFAKGALLFAWAPLAWILYSKGLAPAGTFVIETSLTPSRLVRYVYLGWITVKNTPIPVLLLASLGVWQLWKSKAFHDRRIRLLSALLALFLAAILFSAHGVSPDPERFVTAREAHLLIAAAVGLAGFGLTPWSRLRLLLLVAGFVLGIYGAHRFVARETSDPHLQLSYRLARYLDSTVSDSEKVIVLAKPIARELIQDYLDKAFRQGGPPALAQAQRILEGVDTSPLDYQRTLVHSQLGRARLISLTRAAADSAASEQAVPTAKWIAIWSDSEPSNPQEAQLYRSAIANGPPAEVLRAGSLSVGVYRRGPAR